jgi:hypothetical protein
VLRDRNYYRSLPTPTLREEINHKTNVDWQELAIALTERLDDVCDAIRRGETFYELMDTLDI